LWLLVVVGAAVLEESGAKIAAALRGQSRMPVRTIPLRVRSRARFHKPIRGRAQWRAAPRPERSWPG
jgi:hypothetical protein